MAMAPSDPKLSQLVHELVQKTQAGRIRWKKTDRSTAFLASAKSGSFVIDQESLVGGASLVIFDPNGSEVTRLQQTRLGVFPETWSNELSRLYEVARNNALGVDRVIDDLLQELQSPATGAN